MNRVECPADTWTKVQDFTTDPYFMVTRPYPDDIDLNVWRVSLPGNNSPSDELSFVIELSGNEYFRILLMKANNQTDVYVKPLYHNGVVFTQI